MEVRQASTHVTLAPGSKEGSGAGGQQDQGRAGLSFRTSKPKAKVKRLSEGRPGEAR